MRGRRRRRRRQAVTKRAGDAADDSAGPAATQIAIKQLGTNGGGFFNVNSAHPFENPTPLSNFLEMLAILLIPAALCYTFGRMVGDTRQGWAVLAAMLVIFVPLTLGGYVAEQAGNPLLAAAGRRSDAASRRSPAATWKARKCASASRTRRSGQRHDRRVERLASIRCTIRYTPLGGLVPMWLMQLGEVVFGGVGSGLYGMLMFAIVAVFIAGLMVGRTPEYLGKKIEAFEMKMASLVMLIPPLRRAGRHGGRELDRRPATASVANPGAHGFSEILYAFSSAGTTTAVHSPDSRPTRRSTTSRSASRCGCPGTG